jgi:hypothetical protein
MLLIGLESAGASALAGLRSLSIDSPERAKKSMRVKAREREREKDKPIIGIELAVPNPSLYYILLLQMSA